MKPDNAVVTASGRKLLLTTILGKGGEGTVYNVADYEDIAVKIYTDGKRSQRFPKIKSMAVDRLHLRAPFVAFPIEVVTVNDNFAGFTMRKAVGSKPLHQLCINIDRKTEFPKADFRFLLRVALNYAKAVCGIHSLGAIIGDINESHALIDQRGMVTIIDSDSFQYRCFRCLVGKAEYTPPELHGKSLRQIDRTKNHDAFGLAVILFELLFLGRHPFSGRPLDSSNPSLAEAIRTGRFAYSSQKSLTMMEPPLHVPVLTDLPIEVGIAFERALDPNRDNKHTDRPSASEWISLLQAMEKSLIRCESNLSHYYSRAAPTCPWCGYEQKYSTTLFPPPYQISSTVFNLNEVVRLINAIESPGPTPDLLLPIGMPTPTSAARQQKGKELTRTCFGLVVGGFAVYLMINGQSWGVFLLVPAAILLFTKHPGRAHFVRQMSEISSMWENALKDWERNCGPKAFLEKRADLLRTANSYRDFPNIEREMLTQLDRTKAQLQLRKYLESHRIERANIDTIGVSRKLTLRSFGIETAWDIKRESILLVPGFGPALAGSLLRWRQSVEQRFRYNASIPTDPSHIAKIKSEISTRRSTLERELLNGVEQLKRLKAKALSNRSEDSRHRKVYIALRQAAVDLKFLEK